jgi:hypothetical protein
MGSIGGGVPMRRALFYSRAAAAVSLLLLAICISTVRPVRPTYSPPRVSRADLATVFRVKNTICLGTGEHATFTSDRHGVFRDPVFSIEYISRSLLPLSALSDGVRFDIDYESCCSSDDVDPCTKRCVIVRHGSDRLEYFDAVGSGSKVPLPLTQVHRRLILLKDHDRIAVWIDGVPLSTRRSQFKQIMVRRDPAPAPAATGAIIVQGTGCLDEITVSAHWRQSNLTSVPLDLRISPESSQQRHWDWYPPSPYLGSDSIKPNVVILAPLSGQVFGRADEIPARWAVTAKLDLLYNNGLLQQCLSIFNANDKASTSLGGTCSPARNPAQSMILDASQFPLASDTFIVQIAIKTSLRKVIAASNVTIHIDDVPPSFDVPSLSILSRDRLGPGIRAIGLGPGIPPFLFALHQNLTIGSLNGELVRWIDSFLKLPEGAPRQQPCEILAIVDEPSISLVTLRSMLLNTNLDLHRFLSQSPINQLTTSPHCGLPGDTSLGLKPTRKEMVLSHAAFTEKMPCMDSGTRSDQKSESICFPLIPKNDDAVRVSARWEWRALLSLTIITPSSSSTTSSTLVCKRETMSFESVTSCRCQSCAVQSALLSHQEPHLLQAGKTPSAQILSFGKHESNLHLDHRDILVSPSRHARIFSSNTVDSHVFSSSNSAGVVVIQQKPAAEKTTGGTAAETSTRCTRRRISDMSVHFASIGTALNIYHVFFDLIFPIYNSQIAEYGSPQPEDAVVVLAIGNAAKTKGGADAIIRLAQWYDLPLAALLAQVARIVVSRAAFDQVIHEEFQEPLCLSNAFIGHELGGFLRLDFDEAGIHATTTPIPRAVTAYQKRQRKFNRFVTFSLLRWKHDAAGKKRAATIPSEKDGLAFIVRGHNRRWENLEELVRVAKRVAHKRDVVTIQPQRVQFRQLISMLQSPRISIAAGVSGAGVTNFMFLRPGSVVLFVIPLGTNGYTHHSYGFLLPASGIHFVNVCRGVWGPQSTEGWSGTEDEESRLAKDTDVRIDPKHFVKALRVADQLLRENVGIAADAPGKRKVVLP